MRHELLTQKPTSLKRGIWIIYTS